MEYEDYFFLLEEEYLLTIKKRKNKENKNDIK